MSKKEKAVERSIAAEHPGPVKGNSQIERRILLPHRSGVLLRDPRDALDIAYKQNITLSAAKVSSNIRIQWLNYNEKDNLSGLMTSTSTSIMLLPKHRELILKAARQLDQDITKAMRDQRWQKIRVHGVELSRYSQEEAMDSYWMRSSTAETTSLSPVHHDGYYLQHQWQKCVRKGRNR